MECGGLPPHSIPGPLSAEPRLVDRMTGAEPVDRADQGVEPFFGQNAAGEEVAVEPGFGLPLGGKSSVH